MRFGHGITQTTNHKCRGVRMAGIHTGRKGVQSFNFMGQTIRNKKVQGSIGDGRLGPKSVLAQFVQNGVGSKGAVFLQQYFQHLATDKRKPQPTLRASGFGRSKRVGYAGIVVMVREPEGGAPSDLFPVVTCHVITFRIIGA
jgi:hypothetical protein